MLPCDRLISDSYSFTSDNQFGFKREHGTDRGYLVKYAIKYYNLHNSPVYTCFLDSSKAYDRVNHWTLFRKLVNQSIHIHIVGMLMFGTLNKNYVLGGEAEMSPYFTTSNGVRQGGMLSPF